MLTSLFLMFAQATTAAAGPDKPAPTLGEQLYYLPLFAGMGLLFYFAFIRPMQKERKQRESLLSQTKKNDDVLLTSGIYGTVVNVAEDKDEITVKIADNTRIRVVKAAIQKNLTNEEALKAQQGQKTPETPKKEGAT
jgi:preprotein translocase subunit YajC